MNEQREFPTPPEFYTVSTGYDTEIFERRDEFFEKVLDYIGCTDRFRQVYVQIENRSLAIEYPVQNIFDGSYISNLVVYDIVAASVLVRRNDNNYCQVYSACYLDDKTVERMRIPYQNAKE